jgi:membrane protease YdiL (CAAX protease family)
MTSSDMSVPRRWGWLTVIARGHFLLFDKRSAPSYGSSTGARLLLIAVVVEALRIFLVRWLYPAAPLLILVVCLLACALLLVRFVAPLKLAKIGLYPWAEWNPVEKAYFVQLLVIANVVFLLVFADRLRLILAEPTALTTVWNVFVPYLFFGFYQEVVYRGILQSELVRRWGAVIGILIANIFYTFGPLHWNYFWAKTSVAVPMFAAIFAIGLFFGILFRRSGNLWMVAVIHGIGNAYIITSLSSAR